MANDKLCFVLGAGASSHFGYPLGNELVEAMGAFHSLIQNSKSSVPELKDTGKVFTELSTYNPISIDYFLYNHSHDEELVSNTKRLLEAVIAHSQHSYIFEEADYLGKWWKQIDPRIFDSGTAQKDLIEVTPFIRRPNKDDNDYIRYFPAYNWVKLIHHRVVANCKNAEEVINELENNISVITFNYDLSFEQALWRYFKSTKFAADGTLKEYLFKNFFENKVIHVYGKIQGSYELDKLYSTRSAYNDFQTATSDNIDVIGVHKSIDTNDCEDCNQTQVTCERCKKIKNCRTKLREAGKVYFLGYAFDEFNNRVLSLKDVFKEGASEGNQKLVFYTNYSDGLICDSSVRGFFDHKHIETLQYDSRITKVFQDKSVTDPRHWIALITKSSRNVYEALEKDLNIPISYQYK